MSRSCCSRRAWRSTRCSKRRMSEDFDAVWKSSVRFRHVSRELEPLLRRLYEAFGDANETRQALEELLTFLAGTGRTDANCETTHYFTNATEPLWTELPDDLRGIL